MAYRRGTPKYYAVLREDAALFEHAADRLRVYAPPGWLARRVAAVVIGFLNGRAAAMRRAADTEEARC